MRAQPCFFLILSASDTGVRRATAMSFVKCSPPTWSTAVCQSEPFSKIARSVVPPPMSTRATPSSFSSGVRQASAAASWVRTVSATSRPARFTQVTVVWATVDEQVTMWTFTSSRLPVMPVGSRMPSWSSTTKSWGSTCRISRSTGMGMALAVSTARRTSSRSITRFLVETAITPRELEPRMWVPAIPTKAEPISTPAMSSVSSSTRRIASTVASRLMTTPLRRPFDSAWPMPITSRRPSSVISATIAQILWVPMSSPTT